MDFSLVSGTVSAISTAIQIGKTAVGVRDANVLATTVASMNDQLLNAQHGLLAHNAELLTLQQQHFQATEELREVKKALAERGRYTLFEIVPGNFALRVNVAPQESGSGEPGRSEPTHYICQPCFEGPAKSKIVLRYFPRTSGTFAHWTCPACKTVISDRGESRSSRGLVDDDPTNWKTL